MVKNPLANTGDIRDVGFIPGSGNNVIDVLASVSHMQSISMSFISLSGG